MTNLFAPAHLALTVVILIWDIVLAGRIAQNRQAPRVFQAVSGLAALLVLPGLLFTLATSTIMTGRAVATMDWVWPAVLVLFAMQSVYALVRRLVNCVWGIPIVIYNILIATIGVTRYMVAHGQTPTEPLVALLARAEHRHGLHDEQRQRAGDAVLSEHADGVAGVSGDSQDHGVVPRVHVARRRRRGRSRSSRSAGRAPSSSCGTTKCIAAISCASVPTPISRSA